MNPTNRLPDEILSDAINLIQNELIPGSSPPRQRLLTKASQILTQIQGELGLRRSGQPPSTYAGLMPPSSAAELLAWGERLLLRRQEAGLTRRELGYLAGVADSTIRNIETGRHAPTRSVVMRLQAVPELGFLAPAGLFPQSVDLLSLGGGLEFSCSCFFAPAYDTHKIAREVTQKLNGPSARIEPSFLYTDEASAAAFSELTAHDGFLAGQPLMPLAELAKETIAQAGGLPLTTLGLGATEARQHVRFVQALLMQGYSDIQLLLLDISQPLLSAGFRHAASVLGDAASVGIFAIQGSFHNVPRYTPGLVRSGHRRVACLLGQTFANLDNEIFFIRTSLAGFTPGDLLLINVPLVAAPADRPDQIQRYDPRLAEPLPQGLGGEAGQGTLAALLIRPFQRYVRGFHSVSFSCALSQATGSVPGSYGIQWRANVRTDHGTERVFSLGALSKRYDPVALATCMKLQGWDLVRLLRFATESHPRVLCLYRKTDAARQIEAGPSPRL